MGLRHSLGHTYAKISINKMSQVVFDIKGMSCSACAQKIQKKVSSLDGVKDAEISLLANKLVVDIENNNVKDSIRDAVVNLGYGIEDSDNTLVKEDEKEQRSLKIKLILSALFTAILLIISMGPMLGLNLMPSARASGYSQLLLCIAVMLIQRNYFIHGFGALIKGASNMDSLVALGSSVSFIYSLFVVFKIQGGIDVGALHSTYALYFESAATILTLVSIGKYFESRAKGKTTDAINSLIALAPKTCRKVEGDNVVTVALDAIKLDDVIELKSGDSIGIDGVVIEGDLLVDEKTLTGESKLNKKVVGSKIMSSCTVSFGYAKVKVTACGKDTTLNQIIALLDKANMQKPNIARIADKVSYIFVPTIITLSLITFVIWYIQSSNLVLSINFAVSVLVISCPCALGLATPTAIMVGTGLAAKHGILFKSAKAIEILKSIDTVVFDKTGTLTTGQMQLIDTKAITKGMEPYFNMVVSSLESKSSHPIANALVANLKTSSFDVSSYEYIEGFGLKGVINNTTYYFGNEKFATMLNIKIDDGIRSQIDGFLSQGFLVLTLFNESEVLALYILGDSLKDSAQEALSSLEQSGIKTMMLTGDNAISAKYIANKLAIGEYKAQLLPNDKAQEIKALHDKGQKVCFVGDGVNDALALSYADIGIGLKGASDIAISSCDVVMMQDNLSKIYDAIFISEKTVRNIKENLFWAFIYNIIAIPIAAGLFYYPFNLSLNPMLAALFMSLSSICVVTNALRLSFIKLKDRKTIVQNKEIKKMQKTIIINGMKCSHCTSSVEKLLKGLPGVSNVNVDLEKKCATFESETEYQNDMLKAMIESLGFSVESID